MKAFLLTCIIFMFDLCTQAQEGKWEVGGVMGSAIYQGDLSKKTVAWQFARPSATVFLSRQMNKKWSLKGSFTCARLVGNDRTWGEKWSQNGKSVAEFKASGWQYGNDALDDNYYDRRKRNLSFTSNIQDLAFLAEYRLFTKNFKQSKRTVSFHVEGGLSVFHFNPKTIDVDGETVALQLIRTEMDKINADGSLNKYRLFSISIPMGMEIKYCMNPLWAVTLDVQWRKTFTDWIDDVHAVYPGAAIEGDAQAIRLSDRSGEVVNPLGSTTTWPGGGEPRGDSKDKDAFLLMGIGLSYHLANFKLQKQ